MSAGAAAHTTGHDNSHGTATGISNNKLAMWSFLGSECLFFGAFISSYLLYKNRGVEGQGPFPKDVYDIPFTSVSSFVLLMSSLSMVLAVAAIQRNDPRRMRIWLMTTAFLGCIFVGGQVFEFTTFIREGMEPTTNVSSTAFYVLTGFHGAHVTIGIVMLLGLVGASLKREFTTANAEGVEIFGLYWHFVDIIWIIIFTVIYLVP